MALPATRARGHVIAVAAAGAQPVTRLAFGLAQLAQHQAGEALLVDARIGHMRGPTCGQAAPSGLADCLTGASSLDAVMRRTKTGGLVVLAAGSVALPASILLSAPPWRRALGRLRRRFRMTVVVAPAVGEDGFSDIVRSADGVVMIIDRQATPDYLEDRTELVLQAASKASLVVALISPTSPSRRSS